jgi:hypothetical protein
MSCKGKDKCRVDLEFDVELDFDCKPMKRGCGPKGGGSKNAVRRKILGPITARVTPTTIDLPISQLSSKLEQIQAELKRTQETAQLEMERLQAELEKSRRETEMAKQRALVMEMPLEKEVVLLCKICMVGPAEMLLEACGHIGTCADCTKQTTNRPIRRVPITISKKAYVVV